MEVRVLGAGVMGLTTAIVLHERGHRVQIWSADNPADTTSARAGAVWYPQKIEPMSESRGWASETLRIFLTLAAEPHSGVSLCRGKKLFHRPVGSPWWKSLVPEFRVLSPTELPKTCRSGYEFQIPVVDMPTYLRYLTARFLASGGNLVLRRITSPSQLAGISLVVNGTGFGARELCSDSEVFPIRGQALRVRANPKEFLLDSDHPEGPIQIIPRTGDCYLGVTSEKGNDSREVDPSATRQLLERGKKMLPDLGEPNVLEVLVGIRPGRMRVRLEAETLEGVRWIHNYGHGSAGVTMSWGCAFGVAKLI